MSLVTIQGSTSRPDRTPRLSQRGIADMVFRSTTDCLSLGIPPDRVEIRSDAFK